MPLPVEQDEPSDPIDVSPLGVDAVVVVVVQPPDDAAELIEQPGLAPRRGRILMSMPCFPTVGRALLCTIPYLVKAFRASPKPRRDITAPTRPASAPTVPQPIPAQDREEAAAKCLMRRVLHFFSESGRRLVIRGIGRPFHVRLCSIHIRWTVGSL
jgi:hypothetical protein